MINIEPSAGSSLKGLARRMWMEVSFNGSDAVTAKFNGILLIARPGETINSIMLQYEAKCEANELEYRVSPAYTEHLREWYARVLKLHELRDSLMAELPALDFADDDALLTWLCQMETASGHAEVKVDAALIVRTFAEHGLVPNMNMGEACKDNFARYIIGQALDSLNCLSSIHTMIRTFTEQWRNSKQHGNN